MRTDIGCRVNATSSGRGCILWFSTPAFDHRLLTRVTSMQLVTKSHDQGWCSNASDGSWSWFELVILSPQGNDEIPLPKKGDDGKDLAWFSHTNPIASKDYSWIRGRRFESDHDIWKHVVVGDCIGVRVCAQYPGWQNIARKGVLNVEEFFDPTLPPRL